MTRRAAGASPLQRELDVAVAAAREAGALLRAEFSRPGGPRGSGYHADVDLESACLIEARIGAAFPEDGYLDEELGQVRPPAERSGRQWIVDPNDGTRWFLKGWRGCAVSIALHAGEEALVGVVFAYNYPDDAGDMICWAEGAGVWRNGVEVEEVRRAERLDEGAVVLVSPAALGHWGENSTRLEPAIARTVPSLAYRIALAGLGDAAGVVSGAVVNIWDWAAANTILDVAFPGSLCAAPTGVRELQLANPQTGRSSGSTPSEA